NPHKVIQLPHLPVEPSQEPSQGHPSFSQPVEPSQDKHMHNMSSSRKERPNQPTSRTASRPETSRQKTALLQESCNSVLLLLHAASVEYPCRTK
ncbi:hypothetical protein Bbelb_376530, partial [Branchiostoma belcheri]